MPENLSDYAVSVSHLTKSYGDLKALDDVSFSIKKGEILGFLGPNGAGKSTTMRIISGLMPATSGCAYICGKSVANDPVSLETPVGRDEDSSLGDFIEDTKITSPVNATMSNTLREKLKEIIDCLPVREQRVLKMRFGLEDGYVHTLEEVGYLFQVTRERIRQIESKALRKLKNPNKMNEFLDFMD